MNRIEQIRETLQQTFSPQRLIVDDTGCGHASHTRAKKGGHYSVEIVSEKFEGLSLLQRHRAIYSALGSMMGREIHALRILTASTGRD